MEISDPKAIRALAHPLRLDLLQLLGSGGPATAAQCGRVLGVSQASCSVHLRQLAKYGFVEDAGPGRDRRERQGPGPHPPPIQVHRYDEHTVILRQSKSVHYEAPFIYLLFGNDRALLLDTGATADPAKFPLRATVDQLVEEWLARHPRDGYQLVVVHT